MRHMPSQIKKTKLTDNGWIGGKPQSGRFLVLGVTDKVADLVLSML